MALKDDWKKLGKDFKEIGEDLKESKIEGKNLKSLGKHFGKAFVNSVEKGADVVYEVANDIVNDDKKQNK
ncbi:MAG: hypothetical protein IKT37_06560 [Clostridia bacterium]|nr:hypothetical protein [Clostridia bacterium]